MPRTRETESREAKVREILVIAERRLRHGGYQELSVSAIARELGIAQNAIYWYFPSKDELFVATMRRMLEKIRRRKPGKDVGAVERILWFTDQFRILYGLRGAMTERARSSEAVAEFVEQLDVLLSRLLSGVLRDHLPADELPVAVETFRSTVEGTFVRGLDRPSRRRVLGFALGQLIGDQPPAPIPTD
jgi:AcrR family transcriptional regulator